MGSSYSSDKESKWSCSIELNNDDTCITYELKSSEQLAKKTVVASDGSPLVFNTNLINGKMSQGTLQCGQDGDIQRLRAEARMMQLEIEMLVADDPLRQLDGRPCELSDTDEDDTIAETD